MSTSPRCPCGAALPEGDENPGRLLDTMLFGAFYRDGVARCRPCHRIRRVHAWRGLVVVITSTVALVGVAHGDWKALVVLVVALLHWLATGPALRDAIRDRDQASGSA
ncbi:MAG: hypothetical protein H6722_14415 [Sandaracinus sp.]|nr:hypothetical protein [Sandaracinus sp.]